MATQDQEAHRLLLDAIQDVRSDIKNLADSTNAKMDTLSMDIASLRNSQIKSDFDIGTIRKDLDNAHSKIRTIETSIKWVPYFNKIALWALPIIALAVAGWIGKVISKPAELNKIPTIIKIDTIGGKK